MRGLDAATITALQGDHEMAHLVTLGFTSPVYLTDYGTALTYDSNTYSSTGHLKKVGNLKETGEIRANTSQIILDSSDQTYLSLFLANNYTNLQVTVLRAILVNGAIQGTPITIFQGSLAGFSVKDSGQNSTITLNLASHWKDWEKKNGFRTNLGSHQRVFASDKFMEFATEQDREIVWGRR